ncbi:MAG: hypothetical protein ACKO5K_07240 [Armatimonadota bacterium]
MRKFRWWNSFNLLGILLIGVALVGLVSGGKFVFDPGRPQKGYEWALYLVAGVLMLVNGFLSPTGPQRKEK